MNNRYDTVPGAFGTKLSPNGVAALPPITREQAAKIATLIVRKFWPTHGRSRFMTRAIAHGSYRYPIDKVRRVWLSKMPTTAANSSKGLGRLVHDLSHDVFHATYPSRRDHDPLHARYEIDIAEFVGTSARVFAILHAKPKAPRVPPTAAEKRHKKLAATRESIKRWESKAKRAATALRKLRARERGLRRAMFDACDFGSIQP